MMTTIDGRAARAARQHGLLTRAQAVGLGYSGSAIDRRVRDGQWHRVAYSVYRLGGTPMQWNDKVHAICLATGGVASHRTAAVLLGADVIRPGRVEVTVPRGRRFARADARVHQSIDFDRIRVTHRDGIPVTCSDRLAVDLGAVVPFGLYAETMQQLLDAKAISWPALVDALLTYACPGRRGIAALRKLVAAHLAGEADGSALERALARRIRASSLPPPEREVEIHDEIGFIARVDFAYPKVKLAIELDSKKYHLNERAFEEDRRKRNRLKLAGWIVLEFTWQMVMRDPDRVLAQIGEALRQRAA
jgi:very-short-patch-repair endonuclease